MTETFATLSSIPLQPDTCCEHPESTPELSHDTDPAINVMTDFQKVKPITIWPEATIDAALKRMATARIRLLLVTDDQAHIVGVITTTDIQGDKPIRLIQETRIARAEITVDMLMTRLPDITALNMLSVRNAQVGHIVATLKALERQHALVVEIDEETGKQSVRGLFSTSMIRRRVGHGVENSEHTAHSLAEIQHELG